MSFLQIFFIMWSWKLITFLSICSYAKLVSLGKPDLIEVKGVTYCGTSKASKLTMENVPWHEEVIYFVKKLVERLPDYDISCEHEHSNCLLITHKKVKFISSEVATKFCEIFILLLSCVVRWRFRKILWPSQNIWTLSKDSFISESAFSYFGLIL